MKTEQFKDLLKRYVDGSTDSRENTLVERWYNNHPDDEESGLLADSKKEEEIKKAIYQVAGQYWHAGGRSRRVRFGEYLRYAAAAALIFTAAAVFWRTLPSLTPQEFLTYSVTAGKLKKFTLPDSSVVWLNAASSLRIPEDFAQREQREIFLDEGEAFFQVTHDRSKPFIVHSDMIDTRVLGTSFNVRSYTSLNEIKVTVSTGRVKVSSNNRVLAELDPDKQIVYNKEKQTFSIGNQASEQSNAWKEGRIWLKNAGFNELALALKNAYGIELIPANEQIRSYRFSLQINTSRSIEKTIGIICSVHQNHFRRKGNVIEIY